MHTAGKHAVSLREDNLCLSISSLRNVNYLMESNFAKPNQARN